MKVISFENDLCNVEVYSGKHFAVSKSSLISLKQYEKNIESMINTQMSTLTYSKGNF